MVPLLLLLLLPEALADDVCLNITDGDITITIPNNLTNVAALEIVDKRPGDLRCTAQGFPCDLRCTVNKSLDFNGSSFCLPASTSNTSDTSDTSDTSNTSNTSDTWTSATLEIVIIIEGYYNCTLIQCENEVIMPLIYSLKDSDDQENMTQLLYLREKCPYLFNTDLQVKKAFIRAERQIIHNIMETTEFDTGGSKDYNLTSMSLHVVNVSEADLASADPWIQIEAPQLLPKNEPFIPDVWLPVDALQSIPQERRVVCLVSYINSSQFQFAEEEIASMVLRIELLDERHFHNLTLPIKMIFRQVPPTDMDDGSWLQCHYFDEKDFWWKTGGCETSVSKTAITCKCNHATPFAVLLMRDPISKVHWEILSYISYIGCGLSAFFTALSIVIFVFSRNHRMDFSISIHVSLSGALFLLNTTFLLSEWGATVEPDWVCVFVAAAMHYSLLCCFTWMAIEALHLYLLLIKVFNTYFKHYLVKLSLAGWGIPGIIVAVSLGVKDFKQFYGVTQMSMADTNQTNAICWITDESFFYSLNLVYFTLVFIFNTGILLAVASNICKMKRVFRSGSKPGAGDPVRFGETCRSSLTVMGLTCLMGTTWGLAFLGSGYVNYTILYLFCILNSTQGFFIFLWICLSAKKQRRRDMEERLTSTPVKTSGAKYD